MGLPYVLSSDLVSAYPAKSLEIAQYVDGLIPLLAMTQNAQTGVTYSFVLTDFTKLVTLSNASAVAVTLPLEATVAWPTGTQLRLLNVGAGTVTVAGAVGVTINGTPLTLAQYKGANLIKTGTNTWVFIPFASGIGAAVYSDANTGSYTGFAYKTFTASGTLTVTTAGFADLVVVGGGGSGAANPTYGGGGGGGGGGFLAITNAYLPAGTLTVTIGAGGAVNTISTTQGTTGLPTRMDTYYAPGGAGGAGPAATSNNNAQPGASGGGAGANGTGGAGVAGIGFAGGSSSGASYPNGGGGGGGGGSAVGATTTTSAGAAGGAGGSTSIAGTTPTGAYVAGSKSYAGGGGGGSYGGAGGAGGTGGGGAGAGGSPSATGAAAAANTGGGGGGSSVAGASNTAAGGSGILIIRVAV